MQHAISHEGHLTGGYARVVLIGSEVVRSSYTRTCLSQQLYSNACLCML